MRIRYPRSLMETEPKAAARNPSVEDVAGRLDGPLEGEPSGGTPSIEQSELLAIAGIWFVAFLLRFAHLWEIRNNDPFFRNPAVDPTFYHEWAVRIANGDVLGEGVFLQGPLYPYLLSLLYSVAGPDFFLSRFFNAVIGAVVCVMIWRVARELFDRRTALIAAAMYAVYGMAIFYEGSLLISNLLLPLSLGVAWLSIRALEDRSVSRWLALGVLVGVAALARPNMLLFAPFTVLILFVSTSPLRDFRQTARLGGCLFFGVAVAVSPATLRNYAVAGDPVLISASGGMNFYNGNNPDANGIHNVPSIFDRSMADHPLEQNRVYKAYAEEKLGRTLKASEVSSYWMGRGFEYVGENPGEWLQLLGLKFMLFVNAHEMWNNRSFSLSQQFSWVLRLPLLGFSVVGPLAMLGLAVTFRDWRRLFPLSGVVGVYLATCVVFFVLSRYRIPAVPVFVMFAAAALVWLYDALLERRATIAIALVGLVAAGFVVNQELRHDDLSVAYYNLGNKYRLANDHEKAIDQYRRSLAINVHYISAHNNLAISLEKSGTHRDEAIEAWRRLRAMGMQRRMGRYVERAERHLRELDAI